MSKFYLTVDGVTENAVEIKRSKFIATLAHVEDGEEADAFVRAVRKKYPDATHNCYAYIADERGNEARFSDDGEPARLVEGEHGVEPQERAGDRRYA